MSWLEKSEGLNKSYKFQIVQAVLFALAAAGTVWSLVIEHDNARDWTWGIMITVTFIVWSLQAFLQAHYIKHKL